jgi:hypothetical protein
VQFWRRSKTSTFEERLSEEAVRFRKAAEAIRPGTARDLLLRRARQAETASHIKQASACREKAQSDPAQHDYWIDEAVVWLQRAIETRYSNAVTHEIRIRVPKTAK